MSEPLTALIMQRLAVTKNDTVGRAIGHDASHISRIASDERGLRLSELEPFLSALGLTVTAVGASAVTLPAEEVRALQVLARKGLRLINLGGEA